jgi:hypothetical protein
MPRPPRPRGSLSYDKPPMALDALVDRLAGRGLEIPDPDRAARYLRHIGYYRLSPYTIPFQQGRPDHLFRDSTGFDDVLDLYVFDRALRLLVMDALERVEVAVRAALTDHVSTTRTGTWTLRTSAIEAGSPGSCGSSGIPTRSGCVARRTPGRTRWYTARRSSTT